MALPFLLPDEEEITMTNEEALAKINSRLTFGMKPGLRRIQELLGELGIWLAVPAAEALGLAVAVGFLLWGRRRYGYGAPADGGENGGNFPGAVVN